MSATSRPIHPALNELIPPNGVEHAVWANFTQPRNLITAHGSCVTVYKLISTSSSTTHPLRVVHKYNCAGNVKILKVLRNKSAWDDLLIGFEGQSSLCIVEGGPVSCAIRNTTSDTVGLLPRLIPSTLLDFTSVVNEQAQGATEDLSDLEVCFSHEFLYSSSVKVEKTSGNDKISVDDVSDEIKNDPLYSGFNHNDAKSIFLENDAMSCNYPCTAVVNLGRGISLAAFEILQSNDEGPSYVAEGDPFVLDLRDISRQIVDRNSRGSSSVDMAAKMGVIPTSATNRRLIDGCTNLGEIFDLKFIHGYSSPTFVLLHGNSNSSLSVTAITLSVKHRQAVVLWSTESGSIALDALYLVPLPTEGLYVVNPNAIAYIDSSGRVKSYLAVNGLAHSTIPEYRKRKSSKSWLLKGNPEPLPLLSIQLDGSRLSFLDDYIALVGTRNGRLYSLELHDEKRLSLTPLGTRVFGSPSLILPLTESSLIFCGSYLADSSLLRYEKKSISISKMKDGNEPASKRVKGGNGFRYYDNAISAVISEDEDFDREDTALYEGYELIDLTGTDVTISSKSNLWEVQALTTITFQVMDTLLSLAPIGSGCEGPLPVSVLSSSCESGCPTADFTDKKLSNNRLFTCGFGRSGGLATLHCPGSGESPSIITEMDMYGAENIFYLPNIHLIIICRENNGALVMRGNRDDNTFEEIDLEDWSKIDSGKMEVDEGIVDWNNPLFILRSSLILSAHEVSSKICMIVKYSDTYAIVLLEEVEKELQHIFTHILDLSSDIISLKASSKEQSICVFIGAFADGTARLFTVNCGSLDTNVSIVDGTDDDKVTAVELFSGCGRSFGQSQDDTLLVGLSRSSGVLEVYLTERMSQKDHRIWYSKGFGSGASYLSPDNDNLYHIKSEEADAVVEFLVYKSGPCLDDDTLKSCHILSHSSKGDIHLYSLDQSQDIPVFTKINLGLVTRPSEALSKHRSKLMRKGMLDDSLKNAGKKFLCNRLRRFHSISGQSGAFACVARPLWFVSERGYPTFLHHKVRHASSSSENPVSLFVPLASHGGFMTVHERIGKIGTQRLTLYKDLDDVFAGRGLLPGGGMSCSRIPLGVTVRSIQFIDDSSISSPDKPYYAMVVSHEMEKSQEYLNDDGLTEEEREVIKAAKEAEKTKRQVEADLGGYDVEQEWVEEIERDSMYKVNQNLGGAPPLQSEQYEVWLMNANGWKVEDRYPLNEFEHGMTMKMIILNEVPIEEPNKDDSVIDHIVYPSKMFIAVGTAVVDADGEDVSSKGRVLLFEVVNQTNNNLGNDTFSMTIDLYYEKNFTLGPITSLATLTSEGKNRLVVGAGAEVTVEQLADNSLTQVGFFHANMHVQNLLIFKNFLLLSDAYDSLHFLVWRETDKSLTLLAKDYEPSIIYASGYIIRGGSMGFICHDERQNLQFFQYAPSDENARGGNKLVCRSDFHLGASLIDMASYWCRTSLIHSTATPMSTWTALQRQDAIAVMGDDSKRFGVNFGTTDGSICSFIPVGEQVYWRLAALQSIMTNAVEMNCGLNSRAWRLFKRTAHRSACQTSERRKGVIDCTLLKMYIDLPLYMQEELASAIASTVDQLLDGLLEVDFASMII